MPTIYEIEEPKDAWGMVSHFLGNDLMVIQFAVENHADQNTDQQANVISHARRGCIGGLYVLVCKMRQHGHEDDASKIQEILNMVVEKDVADPDVRQAIHDKHHELNAQARQFAAALRNTAAEHAG